MSTNNASNNIKPQEAGKECKILINIIDQKGLQLVSSETIQRVRSQLATELSVLEAAAITAKHIEPYRRPETDSASQEYLANLSTGF